MHPVPVYLRPFYGRCNHQLHPVRFLPAAYSSTPYLSLELVGVGLDRGGDCHSLGYVWYRGMRDAGEETMVVKKEHTMYGGIYEKIRHPQAVGELPFWWVIAFLLHSPFLVLYSFVWIPIFIAMCLAEERDLRIRYGQAYVEYQKRTGFLLPKWG